MIQTIIIDEEQPCIDRLSSILSENHQDTIQLCASFRSLASGMEGIKKVKPELVFLDVMPENDTAFDLLQRLGRFDFELVFTTAYETYAVKAFKCGALDYLLKPVEADDLKQTIDKLKERILSHQLLSRLEVLMHNLDDVRNFSKRIAVPTMSGLTFLNIQDIIRCQSDVNYTTLFLANSRPLLVSKTLKEFEELLQGYHFFRVHNSHLINLHHLKSYNKGKGGYVIMNDNSEIEVSTRRKVCFLKTLTKV